MIFINKVKPSYGDTRVITSYCIIPREIKDKTYWLTKINVEQVYTSTSDFGGYCDEWVDTGVL